MKVLATWVLALLSGAAAAHHGWSSYDAGKAVSLTGNIVEARYTYPHATIKLQTPDKTWEAVLAPPSRMARRGLPSAALKVGDHATMEGYPSRREENEMRAERIIIGGKAVELR